MKKTTLLPKKTIDTTSIPKDITVKEQYQTTKILGILFNEDLHNVNQMNWQNILEKMENHVKKLTPRLLSLNGKLIIMNTLILSKTSYLSNVFPIDAKTTSEIHKNLFKYLWNNSNSEPITRKTMFLKKKFGGLNLIEPEAHNFTMQIKH